MAKKVFNVIFSIVTILIIIATGYLIFQVYLGKSKGYSNLFGYSYFSVASGSMDSGELAIKKGDMIKVKILDDEEKSQLEIGEVITFFDSKNGVVFINTHRIVEVNKNNNSVTYTTKGDANLTNDTKERATKDIIGVYQSKSSQVGKVFLFFQSTAGTYLLIGIIVFVAVVYTAISYTKKYFLQKSTNK